MENQEVANAIQQFIKALVAPIVKAEVEQAIGDAIKNSPVLQLRVEEIVDDTLDEKVEGKVDAAIDNYDFRDAVEGVIDNYDFDDILNNHDFGNQIEEAVAEALENQLNVRGEIAKVLREMADAVSMGPKIV